MWKITKDKTHKLDSIALDRIKKINNGQKIDKNGQNIHLDKMEKKDQ